MLQQDVDILWERIQTRHPPSPPINSETSLSVCKLLQKLLKILGNFLYITGKINKVNLSSKGTGTPIFSKATYFATSLKKPVMKFKKK